MREYKVTGYVQDFAALKRMESDSIDLMLRISIPRHMMLDNPHTETAIAALELAKGQPVDFNFMAHRLRKVTPAPGAPGVESTPSGDSADIGSW